ncbi:MAG: hypothetical protein JWR12_2980 [Mucilaginibacter sp.]|nr:hypothetical protein [Mucilaginibacter sp.]
MKTILKTLPPGLLLLLFACAAAGKPTCFSEFRMQPCRQAVPHGWAGPRAYPLPATELRTVFLLIFPGTGGAGLFRSPVLLPVYAGYILLVHMHAWNRCSRGFIAGGLYRNAHRVFTRCLVALNLIAISIHRKERRPAPGQ